MKKCISCKVPKALTQFHKRGGRNKTFRNECKDCVKAKSAKSYKENKDEIRKKYNNSDELKAKKAKYQAENKDKVKAWQAKYKGNTERAGKKSPYKGEMLTIAQVMALPECTYSRVSISNKLNAGKTIEEILHPPTKEEKDTAQKLTRDEKARQRVQDKQIIKAAKADIKRQAAIKIMSVPIAEKSTAVYWLMKAYTYKAGSNMEPIQLTKGRG